MRSLFVAFVICVTAAAAQADTVLRYAGPAFDSITCNRPCHFTHISFSVRVPGSLPANGLIQFCAGTQCTNSLAVTFSDGQSRLTKSTAAQYEFSGQLQLDQTLTRVTSAFVAAAQINARAGTLIYMDFGQLTSGDALGGDLRNFNVDASASTIGAWSVKPVRN